MLYNSRITADFNSAIKIINKNVNILVYINTVCSY